MSIELVESELDLVTISIELWIELGEVIRSLFMRNYVSVLRTLRWMIETYVFWIHIQFNREITANDRYHFFIGSQHYKIRELDNWEDYLFHFRQDIIADRLILKEDSGEPSFKEMVNSLDGFKEISNNNAFLNKIKIIQQELKDLYPELSSFIHVRLETLLGLERWNDKYSPFIGYDYNEKKFNSITT